MATQSNLLSPDELTALTEGIKDGLIEVDTGYNTQARVSKHDLTSEDSSLGVNVSSIDMINERFIRMFRFGLLEVLRTSPRVNPTRVQIVKYGDYLKELKPPSRLDWKLSPASERQRQSAPRGIQPELSKNSLTRYSQG